MFPLAALPHCLLACRLHSNQREIYLPSKISEFYVHLPLLPLLQAQMRACMSTTNDEHFANSKHGAGEESDEINETTGMYTLPFTLTDLP